MRERREGQGREEESFEIFEGRMDTIQKGKRIDRRDEVKRQPLFFPISLRVTAMPGFKIQDSFAIDFCRAGLETGTGLCGLCRWFPGQGPLTPHLSRIISPCLPTTFYAMISPN